MQIFDKYNSSNNEVDNMSKSKVNTDVWEQIFADIVLENEPPSRYIIEATIVTKNGAKIIVSPEDFAELVARERNIDPEHRDIQSCAVTINFAKVKRDVNKWANLFFNTIETNVYKNLDNAKIKKTKSKRTRKKVD